MLEELNIYAHGFVAIHIILTCRDKGLFLYLKKDRSFNEISEYFKANSGYLAATLKFLESLGLIDNKNRISLTKYSVYIDKIPNDFEKIIKINFKECFSSKEKSTLLTNLINFIIDNKFMDSVINSLLEGVILLPLIFSLIETGIISTEKFLLDFSRIEDNLAASIKRWFLNKKWITEQTDSTNFTQYSRYLIENRFNWGIVYSYRPLLLAMEELIFGNAATVFETSIGFEKHVDRQLNIKSSGIQHKKYFADIEAAIINIFNQNPIHQQPKYIADMGCGNGTLLKNLYDVIKNHTLRGKNFKNYPLTLIALDFSKEALLESEKTLKNYPFISSLADVSDPETLTSILKEKIDEISSILHIRSFLDHDRRYQDPEDKEMAEKRSAYTYNSIHINQNGELIPSSYVIQNLVEHLQRWAKLISKNELIILEVHCLSAKVIRENLNKTESLSFDLCQIFSRQQIVEAEEFLICAAEAHLFVSLKNPLIKYPQVLPYCRITFTAFEKRPYSIRRAFIEDIDNLVEIEKLCWSQSLQVNKETLLQRLTNYPNGQFVMILNKKIVGVLYTQKILDIESINNIIYNQISNLHNDEGEIYQLISLNIDPTVKNLQLGHALLKFFLDCIKLKNNNPLIIGVTRCKNFKLQTYFSDLKEYVSHRTENKKLIDPILNFHESHGAEIIKLIANYRPEDIDNDGYGILIGYNIYGMSHVLFKKEINSDKNLTIKTIIVESIQSLKNGNKEFNLSEDVNLNQLGFDSLELMELRTLLEFKLDKKVTPTLFFNYPTLKLLVEYFENSLNYEKDVSKNTLLPVNFLLNNTTAGNTATIVGMSCRFPKAKNLLEYWHLLLNNQCVINDLPEARLPWFKINVLDVGKFRGGYLEDPTEFDNLFFQIAPKEASQLDPQQRLLLELVWECIENAGIAATMLAGKKVGVFIGLFSHDYEYLQLQNKNYDRYFSSGNSAATMAGRVAYFFDFRGPTLTIDTACSSSLVALHNAVQSLKYDECDWAIVGGVNLILSPVLTEVFMESKMLSPDALCKTFDATADGYVRSEGGAALLLTKYSIANKEKCSIKALIRGSAINHDGRSNGLTAPNGVAQEELLKLALRQANLNPCDIKYVEAHGTGTVLGDPIEIDAINNVFANSHTPEDPLLLGSVKTNIGHTEAVAGLAGLIKVVLAMEYKIIPAHLHLNQLNPLINLSAVPIVIASKNTPLHQIKGQSYFAGISSFGFSGTNAHVILEKPMSRSLNSVTHKQPVLKMLLLSSQSASSLRALAKEYCDSLSYINSSDEDIAYTTQVGRVIFKCKLVVYGKDRIDWIKNLTAYLQFQPGDYVSGVSEQKIENLYFSSINNNEPDTSLCQLALGYVNGYKINWISYYVNQLSLRVALPTYQFNRQKYWLDENDLEVKEIDTSNKLPETAPKNLIGLTQFIKKTIINVLKIPEEFLQQFDHGNQLSELGMDSIHAVEIRNDLVSQLNVSLPINLLYEYPTIDALVNFLSKILKIEGSVNLIA